MPEDLTLALTGDQRQAAPSTQTTSPIVTALLFKNFSETIPWVKSMVTANKTKGMSAKQTDTQSSE